MQTEIETLKKWTNAYKNAKTQTEFNKAEKELMKFHNKYGTIDIPTIKQLIS